MFMELRCKFYLCVMKSTLSLSIYLVVCVSKASFAQTEFLSFCHYTQSIIAGIEI